MLDGINGVNFPDHTRLNSTEQLGSDAPGGTPSGRSTKDDDEHHVVLVSWWHRRRQQLFSKSSRSAIELYWSDKQ